MFNKILKVAEANSKIDSLKIELSATQIKLKEVQKHLMEADDYGQKLRGDLAEKDIHIKTLEDELFASKEENKSISENVLDATAQAAEIVASLGINEPIPAESIEDKSSGDLMEQFISLEDPTEKMVFYKEHRNKLLNLK